MNCDNGDPKNSQSHTVAGGMGSSDPNAINVRVPAGNASIGTSISILLVDNHVAVREAIHAGLADEMDMQVVAVADNAEDALGQVQRWLPDVVVMDIDMPGMSSFDAARVMQTQYPGTQVLFLSGYCLDQFIDRALEVEAAGYLTKGEPLEVIIKAIRTVAGGKTYYSGEVQERIVVSSGRAKLGPARRTRLSTLTSRESEILRHIAMGKAKKQIAAAENISVKTVDKHATSIMNKLGIHDRVELARFAIREGLVTP